MNKIIKLKNYDWNLINNFLPALWLVLWGVVANMGTMFYINESFIYFFFENFLPLLAGMVILAWIINTILRIKNHNFDRNYLISSMFTLGIFLYQFMGLIHQILYRPS